MGKVTDRPNTEPVQPIVNQQTNFDEVVADIKNAVTANFELVMNQYTFGEVDGPIERQETNPNTGQEYTARYCYVPLKKDPIGTKGGGQITPADLMRDCLERCKSLTELDYNMFLNVKINLVDEETGELEPHEGRLISVSRFDSLVISLRAPRRKGTIETSGFQISKKNNE
jgi:hypothetical protein